MLDKACFQHDRAYTGFKELPRRAVFDEVLRDKVFNFAKDLKHDRYQKGLTAILQKTSGANTSGSEFKNEIISNQQLAEKLNNYQKI